MKFSEYIVLDKAGQAVDPLGFRRPAGALQDTLFPQFTVLTLHPVYLEAMCCFIQTLTSTKSPDSPQFARKFRELEILWGLANAEAGMSVINVTKYQSIRADEVRLAAISRRHSIFQRLAYGTLGHYSRAAMHWGLLDASGRKLLPLGEKLASTFSTRHRGLNFGDVLYEWLADQAFSRKVLEKAGNDFGIGALPSVAERQVWQAIIKEWCQKHPATLGLWQFPMTEQQLAASYESPATYQDFWRLVQEAYPGLRKEIVAIRRFERLAAAIQFIFDRRVAVLEFGERFKDEVLPPGGESFAASVVNLAKDYVSAPGFQDARRLFGTVAVCPPDYSSLTNCVVEHHIQHQQSKGTSPFINHTESLVTGRVDPIAVSDAISAFGDRAGDSQGQFDDLQFRFRRQWHLEKCHRWSDWSVGAMATTGVAA